MSEPTAAGNPLDDIIAKYIQAAEAGQVPSRQALVDAHPEYADELRAFFADYDRLDNRADALKLAAHRPPAQRPKVRYLGDFELLEEIAEGGMGLVYKARQESLGRIVALKLVRAGRVAKPIDIARFRIEAEAAAGLDHPNIVPLYEVGEHEGQHYLAMKFIDGPSLAKLPRGSIKTEVTRIEAIARAVDFAHRQGILHRDIKPSNILTDAAGTPYVTDFGLAKRIDAELSLTESGQMLGTAGYIAPEQALGEKGLTVTADVFSLGVVLFERLTGTPAFPGGTILERLRSLHESITLRPTMLMPTLPRDLETVILKCLEREPAKRYATAGALADDLARWQRSEPIVARRVTTMERFWLWCRRNPAVAGLTGAVGALLIAGTGVSSYFAVQAEHRAADAVQARQQAEHNYLEGFLRPMGYHSEYLDPAELYALYGLAQLPDDRMRIQLLDDALSNADVSIRVARQSQRIVQAVIGASEQRRQMALALLSVRQRDATVDPRVRLAACWLAMELASTDLPAARDSIVWAAEQTHDADDLVPFVAVKRLNDEQVKILQPLTLLALRVSGDPGLIAWSADLAVRMDQPAANGVSNELVGMLARTTDQFTLTAVRKGLGVLAPWMDSAAASNAWRGWVQLGQRTDDDGTWQIVGHGIATAAPRLNSTAAADYWDQWIDALAETMDWRAFEARNAGMAGAAERLEQSTAIRASDRLIDILNESADEDEFRTALLGLTMLIQRLDRAAAARAADAMVNAIGQMADQNVWVVAANGLAALANTMDRPLAIHASDQMVQVLENGSDPTLTHAIRALIALAPHVDDAAASRATFGLIELCDQVTNDNTRVEAIQAVAALVPKLNQTDARRAWEGIVSVMAQSSDPGLRATAAQASAEVARRPDLQIVSDVLASLGDAAKNPNDGRVWRILGPQLMAIAANLDQPSVDRVVESLLGVLNATKNEGVMMEVSRCLPALAGKTTRTNAIRTNDVLIAALGKAKNPATWTELCFGIDAVVPSLDPPAALRAGDALIGVLRVGKDNQLVWAASGTIKALAPSFDSQTSMRAFDALIPFVKSGNDDARSVAIALAATLPATERDVCRSRVAESAVRWLHDDLNLRGNWDIHCFVVDQFEPLIFRSMAAGGLTFGDIADTSDHANQFDPRPSLFAATADLRTTADCLRHPACVGETRRLALRRLEELAFSPTDADTQVALAESVVTGLTQPLASGILAAGRQAKWERERKFRTIWDAVEWLHKNHPEIDLDKPYKPRK